MKQRLLMVVLAGALVFVHGSVAAQMKGGGMMAG